MQASTSIVLLREPEHRLELVNPLSRIAGKLDVVGKTLREVMPEDEAHGVLQLVDQVYTTGTTLSVEELRVLGDQWEDGTREEQYFDVVYRPIRTTSDEVDGIMILSVDVTEQVRARQRVKELVAHLEREKEALHVSEELGRSCSVFRPDRLVHPSSERSALPFSHTALALFTDNVSFTVDCDCSVIVLAVFSAEGMLR